MKDAVKLAIKEGWRQPPPCEIEGIEVYHKGDALIDPLFWQCLGKALKLSYHCAECGDEVDALIMFPEKENLHYDLYCPVCEKITIKKAGWIWNWHHFIDWVAGGSDIDSFFSELLK